METVTKTGHHGACGILVIFCVIVVIWVCSVCENSLRISVKNIA